MCNFVVLGSVPAISVSRFPIISLPLQHPGFDFLRDLRCLAVALLEVGFVVGPVAALIFYLTSRHVSNDIFHIIVHAEQDRGFARGQPVHADEV